MPPKFGTSGLRGLVCDLTPDLVRDYTCAFLTACPQDTAVHVGQDLRASSPAIAGAVIEAITTAGLDVVDHGALPTPALALAAMAAGQGAIMITGSHIPADRNGLKFYRATGEITKTDEQAITAARGAVCVAKTPGTCHRTDLARHEYVARYETAFGPTALEGLRIGVYEHSSVAREILPEVLTRLGAKVIRLARADHFIPVDTEAVDPATRDRLAGWCAEHRLDALVSTDGDADRPMVTEASGQIVPGDVLGPLAARMLEAETICTPVSSNTLVDGMGFDQVTRTRIGSPHVIAAMEAALGSRVAGYEANGGFLLGFSAQGPAGPLAPLMTRDCVLPILAPLALARSRGLDLAELIATLPARFTATDRLTEIPPQASNAFLKTLRAETAARNAIFVTSPAETQLDHTDGLRVHFVDGTILHLRPSGNAPEFRIYAEAGSRAEAERLLRQTLKTVHQALA